MSADSLDDAVSPEAAYESAIADSEHRGLPREPVAWPRTTAWRKALGRLRREAVGRDKGVLRADEVAAAYRRAVELASNPAERRFLAEQLDITDTDRGST